MKCVRIIKTCVVSFILFNLGSSTEVLSQLFIWLMIKVYYTIYTHKEYTILNPSRYTRSSSNNPHRNGVDDQIVFINNIFMDFNYISYKYVFILPYLNSIDNRLVIQI